uniref:Uncharacterized protein n=1 Tax=Anguilla anguilla TaxID=7936 RepID=A0A0E9W2Q7_ANGAN
MHHTQPLLLVCLSGLKGFSLHSVLPFLLFFPLPFPL